jgi:hypothetical protein
MRRIGRPAGEADTPSPTLRRLLATRTDTPQARRPLGRARIRRVHAVLHAYLNAAVRRGTLGRNPASNVELEPGRAARPLVWTPARVERWRRTGRRPARSMVWIPQEAGAFLDHVADDRLYPLSTWSRTAACAALKLSACPGPISTCTTACSRSATPSSTPTTSTRSIGAVDCRLRRW